MVLLRISSIEMRSQFFSIFCLFYLFSSTALAASAVLGVDLGTEYIKAALVKPGIPLDIVLTKDSRRKETSAVAFKPAKTIKSGQFPERVYGSDAVALAARFPGDVYPNLKRLLGLPSDNSVVQEYALRHPALKLKSDKTRGTAAFRSGAFAPDEEVWTVEEILAMELQSIQKNAETLAGKGSSVKDLVITVPAFFSAEEKRAVILAADLAGLRVLELISDGLAVGINYATSRTFKSIQEGGKAEHHMVFDMGAGSTKASILKFQGRTVKDIGKFNKTIQEVQVVGSGWDRTLGGDALNAVIVDDMIAQFVASPAAKSIAPTAEDVQRHGRAAAKLWKEAERLRQILSANQNTQSGFEGLYEDVDFRYKITREDFEKLTEAHAARVGATMQKALDMAGLEIEDIDSVILHGGAIRTPFVQRELEKFIGNPEKIRTNVNSDEAAVFGAGFRGAGLSPSFRVKEIRASEGAAYAAGVKWINIHEKPQHQRLFHPTSFLGAVKQYSFKNQDDPFALEFYQHVGSVENVSPGSAEKVLLTLITQNLTESVTQLKEKFACTDSGINVKLSTRLSVVNGELEIVKLVVDCEVDDAEGKESMVDSVKGLFGFGKKDQVPLSPDDEASDSSSSTETNTATSSKSTTSSASSASASSSVKDGKTVITKRMEVIPVKYTTTIGGVPQLPATEITRMKERLSAFAASDRSRALREESLNQLEGFTYKARDLLEDEAFIAASTSDERTNLEAKAKAASDWIYSGGADASREELKAKLKEMKDIANPIELRKTEAMERPEALKGLQDALNHTISMINGITEQIANDTKNHAAFTSAKSASAAAKSTPVPVPDLEDLEDDESSPTTSAPVEAETLAPPTYQESDLTSLKEMHESVAKWLAEKLAEQEDLKLNDDPILLSKDLKAKTKTLTDIHVELIMKSMKQPYKSTRPPKTPKKPKKPKAKKSKKTAASKAGTAEKAGKVLDFAEDGTPSFKVGENGEMPSEEDIMAFLKKSQAETAAKEAAGEVPKEGAAEEKHDEL
ncbi:hypothetical protein WAI453_008311 [Rhynchosporium graminicola]